MYCPACGTKTSTEHKFCRSCGMDLRMVYDILTGKLPAAATGQKKAEADDKALAHRMVKFMSWGGIILFVGLVFVIVGKKYLHSEELNMVGGLTALLGTFIMCYAVFSAMWRGTMTDRKPSGKGLQTQPELGGHLTAERLPEPALSVTESTTRLMETADAKASAQEDRVGYRSSEE
jgi:hypothetical protein